jgi:hypothetical protein
MVEESDDLSTPASCSAADAVSVAAGDVNGDSIETAGEMRVVGEERVVNRPGEKGHPAPGPGPCRSMARMTNGMTAGPTAFALKELTAAEEARIGALVKKAMS